MWIRRVIKAIIGLAFVVSSLYAVNLIAGITDIGRGETDVKITYTVTSDAPIRTVTTKYDSLAQRGVSAPHNNLNEGFTYVYNAEQWFGNAGRVEVGLEPGLDASFVECSILINNEEKVKETFNVKGTFSKEVGCSSFFFNPSGFETVK